MTAGGDGRARVVVTWEPAPLRAGVARVTPASILITASTTAGDVLFDGHVAAVGGQAAGAVNRAEFDAPAGRVQVDMKILNEKGVVLDTDARDLDVPDLRKAEVTILPPAVLRARSGLEFRALAGDPDAPPVPSREFRRTERLLIRVPAYTRDGSAARVSATLLNRLGHPMRSLQPTPGTLRDGVTQFELSLAPLAPGNYSIRVTAGRASEYILFRVRS
jgi:hypothetical protein